MPRSPDLLDLAAGVRRRTLEDVERAALALEARGDHRAAARIRRCAKDWQAVVRRCGCCGTAAVTMSGGCGRQDCPICRDRSAAAIRKRTMEGAGAQEYLAEWVITCPTAPWTWCERCELDSSAACLVDHPGEAYTLSRADFAMDAWPAWSKAVRLAVEAYYLARGVMPAGWCWPHQVGEDGRLHHPHLNLLLCGWGLDLEADRLAELPGTRYCPSSAGCSHHGPGHLEPETLEELKRVLLRASRIPWAERGKGPWYGHTGHLKGRPAIEQQAHRFRYVIRHQAEGKPGEAVAEVVIEHTRARMHRLVPVGVMVGRNARGAMRARYLELRPSLGVPAERLLGRRCAECWRSLPDLAVMIGPTSTWAEAPDRAVMLSGGVLGEDNRPRGPPPRQRDRLHPAVRRERQREDRIERGRIEAARARRDLVARGKARQAVRTWAPYTSEELERLELPAARRELERRRRLPSEKQPLPLERKR